MKEALSAPRHFVRSFWRETVFYFFVSKMMVSEEGWSLFCSLLHAQTWIYFSTVEVNMKRLVSIALGAALCVAGTAYAHSTPGNQAVLTPASGQSHSQSSSGSSSSQRGQTEQQAKESQDTPAHTEFGGQPKDDAARERHHQQYPESAQHLGPQEDEQSQGSRGTGGKTKSGHEDTRQDAVSGMGR